MATLTKLSDGAANVAANALTATLNSAALRIFDGVRPANANTALSTQVLLAELTLNVAAFGAAVAGVATAASITGDAVADNTGTATWFRVVSAVSSCSVFDGDVDTAAANLILNSVAIIAGSSVDVTSMTFSILEST